MRYFKSEWIEDRQQKIAWSGTIHETMTWEKAQDYALENLARLPTVKELLGIVEYDKYDPAINTDFFPDTKHDWYWSGTERGNKPEEAYAISFVGGCCVGMPKGNKYSFRLVRSL